MKIKLYLIIILLFFFSQIGYSQIYTNQEISLSSLALFDLDTPEKRALGVKVDYAYHLFSKRKLKAVIGFNSLYLHDNKNCIRFIESPEFQLPVYRYSTNNQICEYRREVYTIELGLKIGGIYSFGRTHNRRHELEVYNNININRWRKTNLNSTPLSPNESESLGYINSSWNNLFSPTLSYSYILIFNTKEIGLTIFIGDYQGYSFLTGFESSIRF